MAGGILIFWLIIFLIRTVRKSNGEENTNQETQWPLIIGFFIWVASAISLSVALPYKEPIDGVIVAIVVILLLPSVWLKVPIKAGWIVPTYCLSFLALRINGDALRAGAAFNSYRAMLNKRDFPADKRAEVIEWLRSRVMRHKGNINGGDMMMFLLLAIDSGNQTVLPHLDAMSHLPKKSTPTPLARFAFAHLVAHALADKNWLTVGRVSMEWRKNWRLPLASLIECCYHRAAKSKKVNPLTYWSLWLRCGCPSWLSKLPLDVVGLQNTPAGKEDWPSIKTNLVISSLRGEPQEQGNMATMLSADWRDHWHKRAYALHCHDAEKAVALIEQSLQHVIGSPSPEQNHVTPNGKDVSDVFTRLRYQADAIYRRQTSGDLRAGAIEFQEWLNFIETYGQLSVNDHSRYEAYSIVESVVWNWMADLWNIRTEKQLAFMMCSYMYPHAKEFQSEAVEVYGKVLRGEIS